ncbi:hypothetical protein LPJ73_000160 [Coemansia sp. RSA 2703]|nr:hypothetical protein LPJ73_000160 [Coemansia sp. RSA 2703]KAJ2379290.1 hypothetical protein IW150_000274 [Coemansia sp. RSA 2607]KAJ2398356.1 hypothetical protein GGI05_000130 [Coemansia sp. RSA 2603]
MKRASMDFAGFLANAPSLFGEEATQDEEIDPDITNGKHKGGLRRFDFENGDKLSCIRWDSRFHITSTDIIKVLVHRFQDIKRPVVNMKKFEEGVFSDLRCLKPGVDARLEMPRSEFLELLHKHHCVRTQKKQKVFYWESVPHDVLFREALERDLKREAMGVETTTKALKDADPKSVVVIGGIELPLTVPPTLAAHPRACTSSNISDNKQIVQVSATQVLTSSALSKPAVESTTSFIGTAPAQQQSASASQGGLGEANIASSVLSLASMASSTHGDETDGHAAYPDSSGTYVDSTDILHITPTCQPQGSSVPVSAPAVVMSNDNFASQQMHQYIEQQQQHQRQHHFHESALVNPNFAGFNPFSGGAGQPSLSEYITGKTVSVTSSNNSSGYNRQDSVTTSSVNPMSIPSAGIMMPMNDSWTGMDFQMLHKKAADLRANYNEYQPTPTPHHSPKCGAANGQDLLDLLRSDPNALVTDDNVSDFNLLLEKLLGSSNGAQESENAANSTNVDGANIGNTCFDFSDMQYDPQRQLQQPQKSATVGVFGAGSSSDVSLSQVAAVRAMSGVGMDVEMASAANSSGRAPSSAAMGMMDSITSSPLPISVAHSQHITPNQTPEMTNTMLFDRANVVNSNSGNIPTRLGQHMAVDSYNGIFANGSVSGSGTGAIQAAFNNSNGEPGSFAATSMSGLAPQQQQQQSTAGSTNVSMFSFLPPSVASNGFFGQEEGQSTSFAASLAESRANLTDTKSLEILKNLWFGNQANNVPTPRSTRFSRYHPYLKTMARIAHRESPTLVNRVPSTSNPTVAAAAVNVLAAKLNREQADVMSAVTTTASTNAVNPMQPKSVPVAGAQIMSQSAHDGTVTAAVSNESWGAFEDLQKVLLANKTVSTSEPIPPETKETSEVLDTDKRSSKRPSKRSGAKKESGSVATPEEEEEPRRYVCEYAGCTKQFKRHEHLKRHFRVHTGERPYKCPAPDCSKVFARMDNLNQHIRTHVNRKTANRQLANPVVDNVTQLRSTAQSESIPSAASFALASDSVPSSVTASAAAATASPYASSVADEGMSLFNQGVARAAESVARSSSLPNAQVPLARSESSSAPINSNGGDQAQTAAFAELTMSPRGGVYPMRIDMPEEFSLMGREWFVNNNSGLSQQQQQQQQQPLQSPSIENNAVTMLRKITKNNRLRNVGWLPSASSRGKVRDRQSSPFSPDMLASFSNSASTVVASQPYEGAGGASDGFAFGSGMQPMRTDSNNMDQNGSADPLAAVDSSSSTGINTVWLASFLSHQQQQQQQQGVQSNLPEGGLSSETIGFPIPIPSNGFGFTDPYSHQIPAATSNSGSRPRSLKRHIDGVSDGEDVTMSSVDGTHRSLSGSGDEMQQGGSLGTSDSHVNKLVRSGIAPKPHISPA